MSEELAHKLRYEFWEQHREADWLVCDTRTGFPIGAVYYSPDWHDTPKMRQKDLRDFFRAVQTAQGNR